MHAFSLPHPHVLLKPLPPNRGAGAGKSIPNHPPGGGIKRRTFSPFAYFFHSAHTNKPPNAHGLASSSGQLPGPGPKGGGVREGRRCYRKGDGTFGVDRFEYGKEGRERRVSGFGMEGIRKYGTTVVL